VEISLSVAKDAPKVQRDRRVLAGKHLPSNLEKSSLWNCLEELRFEEVGKSVRSIIPQSTVTEVSDGDLTDL
jgi:hypothetical protein